MIRNAAAAPGDEVMLMRSNADQSRRISASFKVRVLPRLSLVGFLVPSTGLSSSKALSTAQPNILTKTERRRFAVTGARSATLSNNRATSCRTIDAAGSLPQTARASRSRLWSLLQVGDNPERMKVLRELREAMPPGQRSRLNSPITARQRVEAILQARRHGVEESVKTSPVALLKEAMVEQAREIVELKQKLAKHEQGSLFDLKHDSADDIASAIIGNLSTHKAKSLADGILARLKKSQKPAG